MEMLIFLSVYITLYWSVYYYFEAKHDANVIRELNFYKNNSIKNSSTDGIEYSIKWHLNDLYEKITTHFTTALLILLVTNNPMFAILLGLHSISIRLALHDNLINKFLDMPSDYVSVSDTDGIGWNKFIRQYYTYRKFIYFLPILSTTLSIIFFIIFI